MLEEIEKWWRLIKKKRLIKKFLNAKNKSEQKGILRELIDFYLAKEELWLLSTRALSKSVREELYQKILYNEPSESDLFFLILSSDEESLHSKVLDLLEKYNVRKETWFNILRNTSKANLAWLVINKIEKIFGFEDGDLYVIVRIAQVEPIAAFAFQTLLRRILQGYGIQILPPEKVDPEIVN